MVILILSATGLLVGASFGATYLAPRLNDFPDFWSLATAMGTTLCAMSFIIAKFARSVRSLHLKFDRDQDDKKVAELFIAVAKSELRLLLSCSFSIVPIARR
jgi:low affinity Fe/Cu permease